MSDQCTKVRIIQVGGVAGKIPLVDLTRSSLGKEEAQAMDEACQQLLILAGADSPTIVGADIPGYDVEIEMTGGDTRTLKIPYRGRAGSATESADINAIVNRLQSLSASRP
jgi:hypothetical protein